MIYMSKGVTDSNYLKKHFSVSIPTSSVLELSEECVGLLLVCDDVSLFPSPSDFSSELMGSRSESKPVG